MAEHSETQALGRVFLVLDNDAEIDVIGICVEALADIPDVNARARIVDYLHARFEPVAADGEGT